MSHEQQPQPNSGESTPVPATPAPGIDLTRLNQRDETVADPQPFDPLRLCVFTTIAVIACLTGPLAVLAFALIAIAGYAKARRRSEEHTSELQSRGHLVCRLLLEKTNKRCCFE